jgi:hypothetical protein
MTSLRAKAIGLLLTLPFIVAYLHAGAHEPDYQGKSLDYWLDSIRAGDHETMMLAFDAIRSMGPGARKAIPELTRLVGRPFNPIELGKDSERVVAAKLYDLAVRSEAIDTLTYIGEAAASATLPLIQWALTIRVAPPVARSKEEHELFVDLVALDVEYRLAVLSAIRRFGEPAVPIVTKLLRSGDPEKRKLAVLILGPDVLPIVIELLLSHDCDEAQLGIAILADMEALVARSYLSQLQEMMVCAAN